MPEYTRQDGLKIRYRGIAVKKIDGSLIGMIKANAEKGRESISGISFLIGSDVGIEKLFADTGHPFFYGTEKELAKNYFNEKIPDGVRPHNIKGMPINLGMIYADQSKRHDLVVQPEYMFLGKNKALIDETVEDVSVNLTEILSNMLLFTYDKYDESSVKGLIKKMSGFPEELKLIAQRSGKFYHMPMGNYKDPSLETLKLENVRTSHEPPVALPAWARILSGRDDASNTEVFVG